MGCFCFALPRVGFGTGTAVGPLPPLTEWPASGACFALPRVGFGMGMAVGPLPSLAEWPASGALGWLVWLAWTGLGLVGLVWHGIGWCGSGRHGPVGQCGAAAQARLAQIEPVVPAGWHSAGLCRQMPAPTNLLMSSGARWVLTPVGPALEGGTRMVGLAWASHPLHSKRSDEHRGRGHRLGMVRHGRYGLRPAWHGYSTQVGGRRAIGRLGPEHSAEVDSPLAQPK